MGGGGHGPTPGEGDGKLSGLLDFQLLPDFQLFSFLFLLSGKSKKAGRPLTNVACASAGTWDGYFILFSSFIIIIILLLS